MSISSKKFCSAEDIEKRNSETTNEKEEMQKYEKRILQYLLGEKIIPMDLKHWLIFHLLKPEFITEIHMVMLYDRVDKYNAIIVTKDKNVYSLNYDKDEHSKNGDIHNAFHLKRIEGLCGKNIKTFARSCSFVLALTEEGEVYFWEFTEKWPIKSTLIQVSGFSKKRIVDIACGDFHFLILTSDGEVYAWEDNIYKKNNWKNTAIFDGNVKQVKHELEKKNVVHIACGRKFNMAITDKNKLYGWGNNEDGQITHSNIPLHELYINPRKIFTFSNKIVKIVCGYKHTLALTNKGEIYAWGNNNCGQVGVNNNLKPCYPLMVNVPQMGKILNIEAIDNMSVAVGYDRSIYVWGQYCYFGQNIIQPFRTKFSRVFDVFAHSLWKRMYKPLIVHNSAHTVRITSNYNYKYTGEVLNILESLEAAFDDPFTSDFTIQVEEQPIYVHKVILNNRCRCFFDSISDSSPVYTISDKFSYVVYKAFLKYLYSGTIDLPLDKALELMELAEMYCETNLKEDCSQIIKQTITESNVAFFYNKAIKYNAKELKEFCFRFALRHMPADILSEYYNKLNMSTQAKFIHRGIQNDVTITSSTFSSPNKNVEERNLEITTKKREMQKYEKRTLQCVLAEKIIPIDLKRWLLFHMLKPEIIPQIHMVMVYDRGNRVIIVTKYKNVYRLDYTEQLRTCDTHTAQFLKEIKELRGKNIKTFVHSDNFILALTEEGEVYFCEIVDNYDSEMPTFDISTFIRADDLSDKHIVDIACGRHHFLVLTSDGEVYAWEKKTWEKIERSSSEESDWEDSDDNQDNNNTAYFSVPLQMKHELEKKKVVHIACGLHFNVVVIDENKIYGWGNNKVGQISVQAQEYYVYPRKIITLSNKIVKLICGSRHTLALTNKGEVYAWGDNDYGQLGVNNNWKPSGPTVVNVPEMGKILDIAAYDTMSVAVNYDKIIFVWGLFYSEKFTIPFPTKFSSIHDAISYSMKQMHEPLIVFKNSSKYVEEVLNILGFLGEIFDDPLTNDLTIRVEGRPIYVHKAILKIRCQYFKNIFQHDWIENIQSMSDSVYTVSEKFSYDVYKAFLKYLYTGKIDLPSENALELMELADMYCEDNLIKDCSQIIKKIITVSNVVFFYNKAIECNAKELEEFCFQFALHHMEAVVLSEEFIKLDTNTKDNFMRNAAKENTFEI